MKGFDIEKEATKMKRFISLVCGSLVLILLFLSPGNAVQAAEHDDCGCPGTVITGAERNKLVANLLKSNVFKQAKIELKDEDEGFRWQGASEVEVRDLDEIMPSVIGFQVMIQDKAGNEEAAAFVLLNGTFTYLGHASLDMH
jgi:hypothetical protein